MNLPTKTQQTMSLQNNSFHECSVAKKGTGVMLWHSYIKANAFQ